MVCKIGDGKGSSEKLIGGSYTIQECIEIVKEQHPTANGVTTNDPCPGEGCGCWAEFKMQSWSELGGYQSCLFKDANTNGGGGKLIFQGTFCLDSKVMTQNANELTNSWSFP